jgi:DNA-binding response OmpR family regulator
LNQKYIGGVFVKILVADKFNGNLRGVKKFLENQGYVVVITGKGEVVLELLKVPNNFDLIIIDFDLDGRLQGVDLINMIIDRWSKQEWLMTGASSNESIPDKKKFHLKPYEFEEIHAAIQKLTKDP